jgi:hypothetical protein
MITAGVCRGISGVDLAYVNTLVVQGILADDDWAAGSAPPTGAVFTSLFWT